MAEPKKLISLISIVLVILSNLAFAQFDDPSQYEGRPIDPSREGIDYYREGDVIVYPAQTSSNEKRMMERFSSGEFSEEEMRKMAKEKFGGDFDEMEFKKSMMEFEKRAERKDAFSYEHEGYRGYYQSPSYEGYSKEHMIFGMLFEHIGEDIDPRDIKQNCNEPDKIADTVISRLKEKIGDFQSVCKKIDEQESKCEEQSKKGCSQVGAAFVREDATEMEKLNAIAYSCPPNKDAIAEACKKRNRLHMEQRLENLDEECKKRFDYEGERLVRECERFKENQICSKEKYMERCMGGIKKEERTCPAQVEPKCGSGEIIQKNIDSKGCVYYYCETRTQECTKEECGPAPGMPNYLCTDGKTVAGPGKCLRHADGKCGWEVINCPTTACPEVTIPTCVAGTSLQKKTDDKGCVYYYCETRACTQDVKQCTDGSYVARDPAKNCEFKPCPIVECTADSDCRKGTCPDGSTYQAYSCSSNKCVLINYFQDPCQAKCPTVTKPTCASDERLETFYDNSGCVASYRCVKPYGCDAIVVKPTCAEGQSLTTKYDDKGCVVGYECVSVASNTSSSITGAAVLSTYDDFLRHCENSWNEQQRICSNTPQACDKEDFIEKCKEQERKHSSDLNIQIEKNCQTATESEIRHAEERCSRIGDEREKCIEHSAKRCGQMKGLSEQCRELMTEERIRKFIVEEATKRCKFKDILADEDDVKRAKKVEIVLAVLNTATGNDIEKLNLFIDDLKEDLKLQDTTIYKGMINPNSFGDIKLLPFVVNAKISATRSSERAKEAKAKIVAGTKAEEAASKLASLRDSDVPNEYLYIIEDKASDVLDVADKLEEAEKKDEQKGIGYKIKLFLGLAKAAEQEEIKQLEDSKSKLQNSIETLAKLIDEVPSDVAKAILTEQVENLKKQQADIEVLIGSKEKKAKGWFGVFG